MRTFGRRLMAIGFALAISVGGTATAAAADPPGPDPILLVHGWRGDPSTWNAFMIPTLASRGRTDVKAIKLTSQDNIVNAKAIQAFIKLQGWKRVDIIAQSMGGLSARQFIKFLYPTASPPVVVDTYTSLGTPQYGIFAGCFLTTSSGGQMCPSSSFLRNLNTGDDTPGSVFWTTIYSKSDGVVPNSSSRLDGGACHVFEDPGVGHNDMDNNLAIFEHVLLATERTCAGEMRT